MIFSIRPSSDELSRTRVVTTSKLGNELEETEDAAIINLLKLRFAVAAGATEAFDAGRWAQQIAAYWVSERELLDPEGFWDWIGEQGKRLSESWDFKNLPWYAEEKAYAGSFAAFVGIQQDLSTSNWRGIALGD